MPSGVYIRTEMLQKARECLAKGRLPAARKKAIRSLRKTGSTLEFRNKMSQVQKRMLEDPDFRTRHTKWTRDYIKKHGPNYKGGNGQELTSKVKEMEEKLGPLGYTRELSIPTKGHKTGFNVPPSYKVDFGNPELRLAVELDGPYHRKPAQREKDKKKDRVLESLGWRVTRIVHG